MTIQKQLIELKRTIGEITTERTKAVENHNSAEYLRLGHEMDRIQREIRRLESEASAAQGDSP